MTKRSVIFGLIAAGVVTFSACSSQSTTGAPADITPANALRACAIGSSCDGGVEFIDNYCELLAWVAVSDDPTQWTIYGCYFTATTCADITACTAPAAAVKAACAGSRAAICQGNTMIDCASGFVEYCAAADEICAQTAMGAACGTGTCDPATFSPTCDGSMAVMCDPAGRVVTRENCGTESCTVKGSSATCVDPTAPCDPSDSCNGTVATSCVDDKRALTDCATWGGVCVLHDGYADCVSGTDPCFGEAAESCADGVITACILGTTTKIDCKSYGLSGCTTSGSNVLCTP